MPGAAHPFAEAFLRQDLDALARTLTPQVTLSSPVISTRFRGRAAVLGVLRKVMAVLEEPEISEQLERDSTLVLVFAATARSEPIQGVHVIALDERGLIDQINVHMRPLAGLTAFAAALAPRLVRRRRARRPMQMVVRQMAAQARFADSTAARLILGRDERAPRR